MTKTTNFFSEISRFAKDADLKIMISMKGEQMTCTFLPEIKNGEAIIPFTATGTPDELDEGFIPEMNKAVDKSGGLKVNTEQFASSIEEGKKQAEEGAKNKAKKDLKPKPKAKVVTKPKAKKESDKAVKPAATQLTISTEDKEEFAPIDESDMP